MRPVATLDRYAFGDFVLERSQQRLRRRDGSAVALAPRLFCALLLFVERAGELLDKDELLRALWPGLFVEENNLSQIVLALRSVLADEGRPRRYIQTVPRRGFRFVAAVTELPDPEPGDLATTDDAIGKGNLSHPMRPLFGRESELAAVQALLDACPVVSIVGAGGIGKTRLALAAAMSRRARSIDGTWWIELAAVNDIALLPTVVASAMGMQLSAGRLPVDALAGALSDQQALLVLDNGEHLAKELAGMVDAIRARAPNVRFLLTSQRPLQAGDERIFRVGPLALPSGDSLTTAAASAAVALFIDRTSALEPGFALNADNVTSVIEVCRRLDGIPLALELAAAHVPYLGIEGVRSRLDQRFKLLTRGTRASPRRQQTLRNALEWSCGLLASDELAVLRRLGVFVGGFTLELAQAVVVDGQIDEWKALNLLGNLIDKSLVVAEPDGGQSGVRSMRYRLLETTRAFALELLEAAGEVPRYRQRHAEAVLALLEAAGTARWEPPPSAELQIRHDLENARAAFDWSAGERSHRALAILLHAASMPLWLAAGLKAEGASRCAALVPWIDDTVPALVTARFWLTVAMMGLFSPRQESFDAAMKAATLFRQLGDSRGTFEALIVRIGVAARRSAHDEAKAALAEAEQLGDPAWPARRRAALALAAWVAALNANRADEAVGHALREVAISQETGSASDEAMALARVGMAEIHVPGCEAIGEARLRQAESLLDAAGNAQSGGHIGYSLSLALMRRGAFDEALDQARRTYRLLRRDGEQGLMLGLMPLLAVSRGDLQGAARAAGYVAAVYARAGLPQRGNFADAIARLRLALPLEEIERMGAEGARFSEESFFAQVLGGAATQR
jgi:predicted ATPase/DNA-binding winged helix-turn-helix (wHTH) protein